jgi:hypothetical protein
MRLSSKNKTRLDQKSLDFDVGNADFGKYKVEFNGITLRKVEIDNTKTRYPSVFFTYRAVTKNEIDKLDSIIDEAGCTALTRGTTGIYNDVEHQDYISKRNGNDETLNAGDVTDVWLEDGYLYAKSRVGREHNIIDSNKKIIGSSYASAWLTVAKEIVNRDGGDIQDHIPEHIYNEFIVDKNVLPYKNVSVEMSYNNYKQENTIRFDGITMINKWDLVRVSFLQTSNAGQQLSGFTDFEIRTTKLKKIISMNELNIRCLCDSKVGDIVVKNDSKQAFELVRSNEDKTYDIRNVDTKEIINVTHEQAQYYDLASDVLQKSDELEGVRSYIRSCMACQGKKQLITERSDSMGGMTDTKPTQISDVSSNSTTLEDVNKEISDIKSILGTLIQKIGEMNAGTRSDLDVVEINVDETVNSEIIKEVVTVIADDTETKEVTANEAVNLLPDVAVTDELVAEPIIEDLAKVEPIVVDVPNDELVTSEIEENRSVVRSFELKTIKQEVDGRFRLPKLNN